MSLDTQINAAIAPVSDAISSTLFYPIELAGTPFPLILGWLVIASFIFTGYFGFLQLRGLGHSIRLIQGKYSAKNCDAAGEASHFQALSMALSGTVGLGNIAGVAVAISIGGAGATFWMILAGFLSMATKFTECTLAVKYRNEYADGSISGGPMYYLTKGLAQRGMGTLGRALAVLFALCCIGGSIGAGNMFQANQSFQQVVNVTGGSSSWWADKGWLFGLVIALVLGSVIIGGARSIARVAEKIVPFMVLLYVSAALFVIASNIEHIGYAVEKIIEGAFTSEGVTGGVLGALIQGFKRAAFSNEAGIGSAAIAHATARTKHPISEGYVALLEPFIDTVVICTMTALVIIITGRLDSELTGVQLTSDAFGSAVSWFPVVLAVSVVLFAFSTMISWFYYGLKALTYITGERPGVELAFKLFFCSCTVVGSSMSLGPVIDFSDAMIFLMAIPNVIGLYILMPEVKRDLKIYQAKLRSGEIARTH